jgi:bifunctional DNA-binding transcriptional regulator/antitoxin component of YhaV-PrlF toxin-antitoxin module
MFPGGATIRLAATWRLCDRHGIIAATRSHAKDAIHAKVSRSGSLRLPAEIRKTIGLENGGDVVIELDGRDLRFRTVEEVVAQAQRIARELVARKPEGSLDSFLAERR